MSLPDCIFLGLSLGGHVRGVSPEVLVSSDSLKRTNLLPPVTDIDWKALWDSHVLAQCLRYTSINHPWLPVPFLVRTNGQRLDKPLCHQVIKAVISLSEFGYLRSLRQYLAQHENPADIMLDQWEMIVCAYQGDAQQALEKMSSLCRGEEKAFVRELTPYHPIYSDPAFRRRLQTLVSALSQLQKSGEDCFDRYSECWRNERSRILQNDPLKVLVCRPQDLEGKNLPEIYFESREAWIKALPEFDVLRQFYFLFYRLDILFCV